MTNTLDVLERIADDLNRHALAHPAYKDSSAVAKEGAKAILSLITALRTADERAARLEGLLREARQRLPTYPSFQKKIDAALSEKS